MANAPAASGCGNRGSPGARLRQAVAAPPAAAGRPTGYRRTAQPLCAPRVPSITPCRHGFPGAGAGGGSAGLHRLVHAKDGHGRGSGFRADKSPGARDSISSTASSGVGHAARSQQGKTRTEFGTRPGPVAPWISPDEVVMFPFGLARGRASGSISPCAVRLCASCGRGETGRVAQSPRTFSAASPRPRSPPPKTPRLSACIGISSWRWKPAALWKLSLNNACLPNR